MQRNTRRQTAAEKRQSDINLVKNSILAFENFIAKYPDDKYNDGRRRQMEMLQSKLEGMTA